MAAHPSQSSTSVSGTATRDVSTLKTSISFPETDTSSMNSMTTGI